MLEEIREKIESEIVNLTHELNVDLPQRIKTAILRKLRTGTVSRVKVHDHVYYYVHATTKSASGWYGKAIVCGTDRGLIIVRHGPSIIRCPPEQLKNT